MIKIRQTLSKDLYNHKLDIKYKTTFVGHYLIVIRWGGKYCFDGNYTFLNCNNTVLFLLVSLNPSSSFDNHKLPSMTQGLPLLVVGPQSNLGVGTQSVYRPLIRPRTTSTHTSGTLGGVRRNRRPHS